MNDPRHSPPLRLFVGFDAPLAAGRELALPETAARHAQVRRVQPGDALLLFDGRGAEWPAEILAMGRGASVRVRLGAAPPADAATTSPELAPPLHVALVMPAGDRMDFVIEKATELGAASLQPLTSERSVLRLAGERAERKREHWQALAAAACEQCGRRIVPRVQAVQALASWLEAGPAPGGTTPPSPPGPRWLLSPRAEAALPQAAAASHDTGPAWVLSGPEGGFSAAEEAAARAQGWRAVHLGPRVLRADTAPLAVLAWWGLRGL
jgi:16S rRNA (uracil1498-N3)-methyltransferase